MRKWMLMVVSVVALMLAVAPLQAVENDYSVYSTTNFTLTGLTGTGTVENVSYAVLEVFSVGCSITDTNAMVATNSIVLKIIPSGETTAFTIPGCAAQVEGSESMTPISTNAVPVYLYKGDTLQVIQTLVSGTNAMANIAAEYTVKTGAKR